MSAHAQTCQHGAHFFHAAPAVHKDQALLARMQLRDDLRCVGPASDPVEGDLWSYRCPARLNHARFAGRAPPRPTGDGGRIAHRRGQTDSLDITAAEAR